MYILTFLFLISCILLETFSRVQLLVVRECIIRSCIPLYKVFITTKEERSYFSSVLLFICALHARKSPKLLLPLKIKFKVKKLRKCAYLMARFFLCSWQANVANNFFDRSFIYSHTFNKTKTFIDIITAIKIWINFVHHLR